MAILSEKDTNFIKQNYFNTIDIIDQNKDDYSCLMGHLQAIVLFPVDIDYYYDVVLELSELMNDLFGTAQNNIANRYIDLHLANGTVYSFRSRCSDLYDDLRTITNCFRGDQVSKNEKLKKQKKKNGNRILPKWMRVIK